MSAGRAWVGAFRSCLISRKRAAYQVTKTSDLQQVVISLYVCPSRRPPRTAYSTAYDAIFAFIDYAGAIPCGYKDPSRTTALRCHHGGAARTRPLRTLRNHSSGEKVPPSLV